MHTVHTHVPCHLFSVLEAGSVIVLLFGWLLLLVLLLLLLMLLLLPGNGAQQGRAWRQRAPWGRGEQGHQPAPLLRAQPLPPRTVQGQDTREQLPLHALLRTCTCILRRELLGINHRDRTKVNCAHAPSFPLLSLAPPPHAQPTFFIVCPRKARESYIHLCRPLHR